MPPKKAAKKSAKKSDKKSDKKAGTRADKDIPLEDDFDELFAKVIKNEATDHEELLWRYALADDANLLECVRQIANTLLSVKFMSRDATENYNERGPRLLFALMRYDAAISEATEAILGAASRPSENPTAPGPAQLTTEAISSPPRRAHEMAYQNFVAMRQNNPFPGIDLIRLVAAGEANDDHFQAFVRMINTDPAFQYRYIRQESAYYAIGPVEKEMMLRFRLVAQFSSDALLIGAPDDNNDSSEGHYDVDRLFIDIGLGTRRARLVKPAPGAVGTVANRAGSSRGSSGNRTTTSRQASEEKAKKPPPEYPHGDLIDLVAGGNVDMELKTQFKEQVFGDKKFHGQVLDRIRTYQAQEKRKARRLKSLYESLDSAARSKSDPRSFAQKTEDSIRDYDRQSNPRSEVPSSAARQSFSIKGDKLPRDLIFMYRWRGHPKPSRQLAQNSSSDDSSSVEDDGKEGPEPPGENRGRVVTITPAGPGYATRPFPVIGRAGSSQRPKPPQPLPASRAFPSSLPVPRQTSTAITVSSSSPSQRRTLFGAVSDAIESLPPDVVSPEAAARFRKPAPEESTMNPDEARSKLRWRLQASQAARRGEHRSAEECAADDVTRLINRTRLENETTRRTDSQSQNLSRTASSSDSSSETGSRTGSGSTSESSATLLSRQDADRRLRSTTGEGPSTPAASRTGSASRTQPSSRAQSIPSTAPSATPLPEMPTLDPPAPVWGDILSIPQRAGSSTNPEPLPRPRTLRAPDPHLPLPSPLSRSIDSRTASASTYGSNSPSGSGSMAKAGTAAGPRSRSPIPRKPSMKARVRGPKARDPVGLRPEGGRRADGERRTEAGLRVEGRSVLAVAAAAAAGRYRAGVGAEAGVSGDSGARPDSLSRMGGGDGSTGGGAAPSER